MTFAAEFPAILPSNAHIAALHQQLVQRDAVCFTPTGTIQIQQISSLGHGNFHARKMLPNERYRIMDIVREYLPQLLHPLGALARVGCDQGVHCHYVHMIIERKPGLLLYPVPKAGIINNAIAADQSGQIEGFGRCIQADGPQSCIFGQRLCGNVAMTIQQQI